MDKTRSGLATINVCASDILIEVAPLQTFEPTVTATEVSDKRLLAVHGLSGTYSQSTSQKWTAFDPLTTPLGVIGDRAFGTEILP